MKLLINICAHDGIESIYAGVGTIVKRYIETTRLILNQKNLDYHINLFTPKYNDDSFGYSKDIKELHESLKEVTIYEVDNGSQGNINYGNINNWQILCQNTKNIINNLKLKEYDKIITIANDTPFANLLSLLNNTSNHYKIWIPHSTVKIHEVDSAIKENDNSYQERLSWEESSINYINKNINCFVGTTGKYIENHLIKEYNLEPNKCLYTPNGELINEKRIYDESPINQKLFDNIKDLDGIILSFGRAEEYKNLEATYYLGKQINLTPIVITKPYYKEQPILKNYQKLAEEYNGFIYTDVPFEFPHYIINHFPSKIVVLIPSKKEIVGLIVNEIRKMNKDNILIAANAIGGLKEQINDTIDGILLDLNDIPSSADKIKKYLNDDDMKRMNKNSQITLNTKYNFEKTMNNFYDKLLND